MLKSHLLEMILTLNPAQEFLHLFLSFFPPASLTNDLLLPVPSQPICPAGLDIYLVSPTLSIHILPSPPDLSQPYPTWTRYLSSLVNSAERTKPPLASSHCIPASSAPYIKQCPLLKTQFSMNTCRELSLIPVRYPRSSHRHGELTRPQMDRSTVYVYFTISLVRMSSQHGSPAGEEHERVAN